ncbi:MAG TPA: hypothetical protein VNU68_34435 [Verrucomicrobiae bacterium]|nr:hypothetical protein [Verrucomicrobiae bacterium]
MKLNWILPIALSLAAMGLTGCVDTLDGHSKFAWDPTKDKVEGRYEFTPAQLWTAAKDVIKTQGVLVSEDMQKNVLEASIDERKVYIHIEEFDTRTSRVLVQARTKGGGADLEMAAFIDKQIAVRLAAGNLTPSGSAKR